VATIAMGLLVGAGAGCAVGVDDDSQAAVAALRAQVETLQSREAIRALYVDYGRTLDERDFAGFARLFTADAEFVGGNGTATGPDAIAANLQGSLSRAAGPDLHVFTNEKIDVQGERATAISRGAWVVQAEDGRPRTAIYATYRDELAVEDGAWKFRRRQIVGDIPGPAR
jgi:uncharacterized protein (TIGR02246 family)